ncbi:Ppx/GppA family phosphatase [Helicobacter aurati]|uniref:Ppx/GppA family phosphatase n=1 Tax=Helicobacter aurati TaxID=137778 RepID=A0A3D8J302_9HELI|nr:Ppx/GppA phosphatase family protein [Helicobacter aurati]RDU71630.1 Ppx/GppA family phosphatase [Helicobacter aurati]
MAKITTIIDIGSNSARMAIFQKTSRYGFRLIHELKSKVRISEGSYEHDSYLQKPAMQRALNALKEFKRVSQLFKSRKLICVATSAIRDAPNKLEFIAAVKKECGIHIKVIDGTREAFFGAVACANLLHEKSGITVDIGGGSTELACIDNGIIKEMISLNLGSIRLKELFFDHNKINEAYNYTRQYVKENIKTILHFYRDSMSKSKFHIFGIGGSIRAYAKYEMNRISYPLNFLHGYELDIQTIMPHLNHIVHATTQELLATGINLDRIDSIRPGLLILQIILEELQAQTLIISGVGVREGVFLYDMLRNQNWVLPTHCNPSVSSLRDTFLTCIDESKIIFKHAKNLFILFQENIKQKIYLDSQYLYHLKIASNLYNIGTNVNFYQAHKHSSYIALHCLNYGFSHIQRYTIATLLEFSHKKRPKTIPQSHKNLLPHEPVLHMLSFILSLSVILAKQKNVDFKLSIRSQTQLYSLSLVVLHITACPLPTQQALLEIIPPKLECYGIALEIIVD